MQVLFSYVQLVTELKAEAPEYWPPIKMHSGIHAEAFIYLAK